MLTMLNLLDLYLDLKITRIYIGPLHVKCVQHLQLYKLLFHTEISWGMKTSECDLIHLAQAHNQQVKHNCVLFGNQELSFCFWTVSIFDFLDVSPPEVLRRCEAMGFGPVTSVIMFTDEPDVPIPEYLLPLYGEYN